MPGWYGVANVKWLSEVHLQENRFLGNFQARWYRTMRTVGGSGGETDPETQWVETEVTRLQSEVGDRPRAGETAGAHQVLGFVLNDGTPLRSVEVQGRRRRVAAGDARSREHAVFVEAVHLSMGRRHARRAHARVARHRRERRRAADGRGAGAGRRRSSRTTRSSRARCGSAEQGGWMGSSQSERQSADHGGRRHLRGSGGSCPMNCVPAAP